MSLTLSILIQALRNVYQNIGALLRINLLWLLCSLPIITWPAATLALYAACNVVAHGREPRAREFFANFRRYFVAGTALGVTHSLLLVAAAFAIWFYFNRADGLQLLTGPAIFLFVFFLLLQLYLHPLLIAQAEPRLSLAYRNATLLVFQNPIFSLSLLLLLAALLALLSIFTGPVLFIAIPAMAVIQCQALRALLPKPAVVNGEQ